MIEARRLVVRGTVQGVGFRPFVARLARTHRLAGWVLNAHHGVEIHVEGIRQALGAFCLAVRTDAPPAAEIESIDVRAATPAGADSFLIRGSERRDKPTARISPDLPVCGDCLAELIDPAARRFQYPYINCTNCGPRFSIVQSLPYDRAGTTMAAWPLCRECRAEYEDASNRRFHAQPTACPACGPHYRLVEEFHARAGQEGIARAAALLAAGCVVAIKGIGGYHLCCDARNDAAVCALRERKFRKAKPFAVMARDLAAADAIVEVDAAAESLLTSAARPIVLLPAREVWPLVAPDHRELGIMLPYAPVHHLLFSAGAPAVLVMTSGNRSSEPLAFEDDDARRRLEGIADGFLIGERAIARRVDDAVVRPDASGPLVLRRGRGYAPGVASRLSAARPIVAVGADLKNTVTLVVSGDAIVSQHIGDLEHVAAREAFRAALQDLTGVYEVNWADVLVAHDCHPEYVSTACARELPAGARLAVQHHRAHIASVLAERGAFDARVVGVAFDGTGYGDDGTIWGGEFFVGSVSEGFSRAASLRPFPLPGGDAAARWPVQAAAGALLDLDAERMVAAPPFLFPPRYRQAVALARSGLRSFTCTSAGRLFDAAAAIIGFTRQIEYEGQAACWLENIAARDATDPLPFTVDGAELDFRPALLDLIGRRRHREDAAQLARAFHEAVAAGICSMAHRLCEAHRVDTVVLSGGTFQNARLRESVRRGLRRGLRLWTNRIVPPNDGGISLGQAAIAARQTPHANDCAGTGVAVC